MKSKVSKQNKSKSQTAVQENKFVVFGLTGIFLVLVFFASSYKVTGDDDFFWHLATGRFIVENKYVPDKDVFGFVTQGTEWIPFEWGWDLLSFGLYNIGGYNAILIFRSLAFSFVFLLYFLLLRKFKVNWLVSIVVLFCLLIGIMDRLSPRPHIITYIFFVTLLYLLMSFRYFERKVWMKRLYFLPLIFLIWGNSHMGVLAGGLLLFIFVVSEIIIYFKPNSFSSNEVKPLTKEQLKRLLIISVVSALMLMINPHGIQTYLYAYSHTKMKMLETVNEWRSPFTSVMDFGFVVTMFKVFVFAGIIILIYSFKKKDLTFALVYIGFVIYSVRAIRFTVDYEIIIAFFLAVSLNYFVTKYTSKRISLQNVLNGNVPKAVAGLFLIYIISQIPSNSIYEWLRYYRVYGWGINTDFIPVQLFDFIKENNISGKPYNHFGTGGYMVWNFPNEKNFIDSRNLNDDIFNEYNSIMVMQPGFEKKLEQRGVDYVVYLDPDLIRRPKDLNTYVTAYFSKSKEWKIVFWDDKSMLFLKNIPKFADVILKYEYKVLKPYTAIFNNQEFNNLIKQNPQIAKDEIDRKQKTEPNGFLFKGMNEVASKVLLNP